MKARVMEWLRCVECAGALKLESFTLDPAATHEEIWEGSLRCDCGARFPVIQGVPRLLPVSLQETLPAHYPEFFARHAAPGGTNGTVPAPPLAAPVATVDPKGQVRVMESFGFEWNTFSDYAADNFDEWVTPLSPAFFRGKLVLDAGCGAGRHAMRARSYGAEVVAMDVSFAVDAAYTKARMVTGVHVVQGDIFRPPFARATFDAMYSIGVLHHTPDPPRAFQALIPCLAPGATAAVMLYASGRPVALGLLASVRALTLRVPLPAVKFLSRLAATIDTVGPIALYRLLRRAGVPARVLAKMAPEHIRLYADHTFDTCVTDWLDRLSYPYVNYYTGDDIVAWFGRGGLKPVSVRALGAYGWVGVGTLNGARDLSSVAPAGARGGR